MNKKKKNKKQDDKTILKMKKKQIKIKMKKFFPQKNIEKFKESSFVSMYLAFQHMEVIPADNTNTNVSTPGSILLVQAFHASNKAVVFFVLSYFCLGSNEYFHFFHLTFNFLV